MVIHNTNNKIIYFVILVNYIRTLIQNYIYRSNKIYLNDKFKIRYDKLKTKIRIQ